LVRRSGFLSRKWRALLRVSCYGLLICILSACSERLLLSGLDESQRLEVVSALERGGIHAADRQEGGKYSIYVEDDKLVPAAELLRNSGLPRRQAEIEALTAGSGFVPPPPEVLAYRFRLARSTQVERMLMAQPRIADARMSFNGETALVMLTYSGAGAAPLAAQDVAAVVRSVMPDIGAQRVEVKFVRQDTAAPGNLRRFLYPFSFAVPAADYAAARSQLIMLVLVVGVSAISVGLGIGLFAANRIKQSRAVTPAPTNPRGTGTFSALRPTDSSSIIRAVKKK
jgi:type III secretory pathway lipoprotein EscJ